MRCSHCGADNPDAAVYCAHCGRALAAAQLLPPLREELPPGQAAPAEAGPPRPMVATEIVGQGIRLWWRNLRLFLAIAAVAVVPLLLAVLGLTALAQEDMPQAVGVSVAIFILTWAVSTASQAATIAAGRALHRGERTSLGAAYSQATPKVVPIMLAELVLVPALLLLAITIVGIPVAIYVGVRCSFFGPCLVLEPGIGPLQALARSWRLVRGQWWRTFGILLLIGLVALVIWVPAILVSITAAAALPPAVGWVADVLAALLQALAGALLSLGGMVLYLDLRARSDAAGAGPGAGA